MGEGTREAWVAIASEADVRARGRSNSSSSYNFGFVSAMGRLLGAHPDIGPLFQALFRQVMLAPGALSRQEREMLAGVAAAAQGCYY